jgi:seryl-tRNA synthetase
MAVPFTVHGGLATLGPQALRIRGALEDRFLGWAAEVGATPMLYPPLVRTAELARLDYFQNFPHLAVVASRIRPDRLSAGYAAGGEVASIPSADLDDGRYVLPSAACFSIYLDLAESVLPAPRIITTVATCCRNEEGYDELRRLWSFTMREIVCLGPVEAVQDHLRGFKERILAFAAAIGLPLATAAASDPFFQPQSSRAVMQRLFPQKEELVYGESLAIGSLNFHRNFFGERCGIRTADGQFAFTGCVAFGVERWMHALLDRYAGDAEAVIAAVGSGQAAPAALVGRAG